MTSILKINSIIIVEFILMVNSYKCPGACNNELMNYKDSMYGFDCALVERLRTFGLTKEFAIKDPIIYKKYGSPLRSDAPKFNFVMACNEKFYKHAKATIASIESVFANYRIILFDLGGTANNSDYEMFEELKPEDFMWADSSIYFKSDDFGSVYDVMGEGVDENYRLVPFQMLKRCCAAMFTYIKPYPNMNTQMVEANLIIIRRTETTRQLLKWAVLCALTKECIEPADYKVGCEWETQRKCFYSKPKMKTYRAALKSCRQ